jgi:hypothetical protein
MKTMASHLAAETRAQRGFLAHLTVYMLVIGSLIALNYSRNPANLWSLWVAGGWGIGIVAHAAGYYLNRDGMIDRTQARMERRTQRRGT